MDDFSHLDNNGEINMVDVTDKSKTYRTAKASGKIYINNKIYNLVKNNNIKKGNVLTTAKIAGIMAAKKVPDMIPLCHQINLTKVELDINLTKDYMKVESFVKTKSETGVEMEAIQAVNTALLTIYDMCKAIDKSMVISEIKLNKKTGGKSGTFIREDEKKVLATCISEKRGTIKKTVDRIKLKANWGIVGDAHADNWHKQVSILSQKSINKFNNKYDINIDYGESAENIVVSNLNPNKIKIGTVVLVGKKVLLEVTQIGKEITDDCPLYDKYKCCPTAEEGFFLKVLKGGEVTAGDNVEIIS